MAWREYVDPTTGDTWTTDDAGNFLPGGLADNGITGQQGAAVGGGKTLKQMTSELRAAGYPGPWDDASVQVAYARTVNGGAGTGGNSYYNPGAANLAMQLANQAAQQAYLNARLEFEKYQYSNLSAYQKEQLAQQKAQQAWTEKYQTSMLTGTLDGVDTLQKQLQQSQIALNTADTTGYYNGSPTMAREQMQGNLTGYYNGQATLGREQMQNQTALGYLNLLGSLRGPQNYFQYMKVLNGTPGGMRDLVNAAAGQYALPGYGGGVQMPIEPASLSGLLSDVGGRYTPMADNGQVQGKSGASPNAGGNYQYLGGASDAQLTSPSQWNARNYARMSPTQKDLLYGYYESKGWRPEDAQYLFQQSLPKYQGPQAGAVRM